MDNKLNVELILHRLDEIAIKQDVVNQRVEELALQLARVETVENNVSILSDWKDKQEDAVTTPELKDIKDWKSKMDELMSPKQFEQHIKEHASFKVFKTQAMMIWVVVQSLMTIALFWEKIFG